MIRDIKDISECPDCASTNIVHNQRREQVICRDCGLIFEPLAPAMEEKFERSHGMITAPRKKKAKKKAKKKTVKKTKKKTKKKTTRKKATRAKKTKKKRRR